MMTHRLKYWIPPSLKNVLNPPTNMNVAYSNCNAGYSYVGNCNVPPPLIFSDTTYKVDLDALESYDVKLLGSILELVCTLACPTPQNLMYAVPFRLVR